MRANRSLSMAEKVVVFGAGATGRGHVGLLVWQAGLDTVFVDSDRDLVDALRQAGSYTVRLHGGDRDREIVVSGWRVYHSEQRGAVAAEVASSDLVLTAVFDQNLPDPAKTIAMAAGVCRAAGRARPLNCIACENMQDSSSTLRRHVREMLSAEDLAYCDAWFGFPDAMISRVVPRPEPDPLLIVAEDYNEWTTRAEVFKGERPAALSALELVDNQSARLERKLFMHNGAHAVCGYIGFHRGHRYIHEAVADQTVAEHVRGALDELGAVVRHQHGFSTESIDAYKADFCRRGAIPEMRDQILRVARQPVRKLSPTERLVAPASIAAACDLPRQWITRGIVAALKYRHPDDPQSLWLQERISADGLPAVLGEVCGLEAESTLAREIGAAWGEWSLS